MESKKFWPATTKMIAVLEDSDGRSEEIVLGFQETENGYTELMVVDNENCCMRGLGSDADYFSGLKFVG